ncbi:MAG TPA: hypothetical protein VGR27_02860, partial [Longimicrobiaceae bacterium]|nr:hypothetical protein [Longimicrobiaceae bacterium]
MSRSFPGIRRQLPPILLTVGVLLAGAAPAGAQNGAAGSAHTPDTVSVVPAARFRAGPIYSFLFGRHYRDLWTNPVRVEVLDLQQFAG